MLPNLSDIPLLILSFVILVWLSTITFLLVGVLRTFARLTKGVADKNLKAILEEILVEIKKEKLFGSELEKKIADLNLEKGGFIQKVGLVRYNPFSDTGGNQSFVLAFLDGHDDGFVVTSLHSREATRVFAKPVKSGKEAGFEFSKEEIQAILVAQKKKKELSN